MARFAAKWTIPLHRLWTCQCSVHASACCHPVCSSMLVTSHLSKAVSHLWLISTPLQLAAANIQVASCLPMPLDDDIATHMLHGCTEFNPAWMKCPPLRLVSRGGFAVYLFSSLKPYCPSGRDRFLQAPITIGMVRAKLRITSMFSRARR